jgi:hypothetical protein
LSAFNAEQIKYLIVGGYAVSYHAQPRATKDLDILIGVDAQNSKAVFAALAKFGAAVEGMSAKDFTEPDNFFRMGTPPVMVDIMPRINGVEFEAAWGRRVEVAIGGDLSVPFISREDLLAAKISAGGAQDLVDVEALRAAAGRHDENRPVESTSSLEQIRAKSREDWLMIHNQPDRATYSVSKDSNAGLDAGVDDDTK